MFVFIEDISRLRHYIQDYLTFDALNDIFQNDYYAISTKHEISRSTIVNKCSFLDKTGFIIYYRSFFFFSLFVLSFFFSLYINFEIPDIFTFQRLKLYLMRISFIIKTNVYVCFCGYTKSKIIIIRTN